MRGPAEGPPRLARRLLRTLVPAERRDEVDEALGTLYAEKARSGGRGRARRWYRRQVAGFALRWLGMNEGGWGMDSWTRDLALAVRSLKRAPGLTALAVVTLALGIGGSTAIFGVIRGSLLRPLPFAQPSRLVWLSDVHPSFGGSGLNQSIPNLEDIRDQSTSLTGVAIQRILSANLATQDGAERVAVLTTSSELLGILGVRPALGRDLLPSDDERDAAPVILLTDALWRSRFGADPDVIGTFTTINARPAEIVGVLPAGFAFPDDPQVVTPIRHEGADPHRGSRGYFGIARLADGADLASLRTELDGIFSRLVTSYPEENQGYSTWAEPLDEWVVRRSRRPLLLMAGAVALVLLIACTNVTNLLLVRAEARRRELAVRTSLGARRSTLLSSFVAEGLVLSLGGGILGILVAHVGVDALLALYGDTLPRASEVAVDGVVAAFALGTALVVGVAVGLVPALRTRPDELHAVLRDGARGASRRASRLGRILVVTEVALAVVVVSGAGLLAHSTWRLQQIPLGVSDGERVMTFRMALPGSAYPTPAALTGFMEDLGRELSAIPGVEAVGFVNRLPLLGGDNTTVTAFGDETRSADFVSMRFVTPGYFDAIGATLLAGREPDDDEYRRGAAVAVINRTLARSLFGEEDAVGRRIAQSGFEGGLLVVGVIGDIVGGQPGRPAPGAFYTTLATVLASWGALPPDQQWWTSALVKTAGDPRPLVQAFRATVAGIDPQMPIYRPQTLQDIAAERMGSRVFTASIFGVFASLALGLGALGIYGVMSYSVAQRTHELGLRMALGARRGPLLRMVLGEGLSLTAPGVALGVVGAVGSARVLGSLLYDVSPLDPWTYGGVALVLASVAAAATLVPALRAVRVDPSANLRRE